MHSLSMYFIIIVTSIPYIDSIQQIPRRNGMSLRGKCVLDTVFVDIFIGTKEYITFCTSY